MGRPLRLEFQGAVYHVFSRGNERKAIFRSHVDYELFLGMLRDLALTFNVIVHAYSLMPNHFHLLIETQEANLSYVMKRLLGLYTARFNRKHKRVGHLFQGRYKAHLVDKDSYFLQVSRYIHLNPVKAKLSKHPEDHAYSSMRYYMSGKTPDFLHKDFTLASFESPASYRKFVLEGLSDRQDIFKSALGGAILGDEAFLNKIKAKLLKKEPRDFQGKNRIFQKPLADVATLCKDYPQSHQIFVLAKYTRATQREIGEIFQISHSAVCQSVRRLQSRLTRDKQLKQSIDALENVMSNVKD